MAEIGQWSPTGQTVVTELEKDGGTVLSIYVKAQVPFLGLPVISVITDLVCGAAAKFIITEIDNAIFAGYVAVKCGKQVSDYLGAQDAGNQDAIDKSADQLIHLGKI